MSKTSTTFFPIIFKVVKLALVSIERAFSKVYFKPRVLKNWMGLSLVTCDTNFTVGSLVKRKGPRLDHMTKSMYGASHYCPK